MTNREFYKAVIEANINADLTAHAEKEIEKLNARNEKRSTTMNKTQKENVEIKKSILAVLSADKVKTANEVGVKCGISTNKASALLRQLVLDKVAIDSEVKIPKKGRVKGYALATASIDEDVPEC